MANNVLSNGRIHHSTMPQSLSIDRGKKVPDIPAIETRNWLLHKHYTRHEYKICKILLEEELARSNGHNEYASYLKGLILRKEGKVQDSMDCFQVCYTVNTRNIENVKQIAKSLFLLGSHRRALEAYLEADRMCGSPDWEILYNLGECYTKLNQQSDGTRCLKRAIGLTADERPYLSLAKIYVAQGLIAEAVQVYTSALSVCSENIDVAVELGLLYLKLGDTQRAFQQFGLALVQQPICPEALLPMASVMQGHQEYDVAMSKYRIAAQEHPESVALWNNIGMCFYGKRKFVAAITCLKRAHYLNPLASSSAFNLGIVFLSTGQPASAAIYLCNAAASSTSVSLKQAGQTYMLLGVALKQLEDYEGAEKAMTKAYSLTPRDPLVLVNFAIIMEAGGKRQRAFDLLVELSDVLATVNDIPSRHSSEITETVRKLSAKLEQTEEEAPSAAETRALSDDEV
ncbi:Bardet-Biedl syndrome 4 protein homolog isoform X1 [Neodiprion virginianus]|uniref:Bardet-Biedl syndrome 4 protein homolog isoform X1 n=2 Tax=Neodiprion virginianus TaxID=2961670 RepID=UPI001EE73898|nr:Bardet-Biedl syndrome 4 protein homolog isoform X1 [Neodiprion virginianus]